MTIIVYYRSGGHKVFECESVHIAGGDYERLMSLRLYHSLEGVDEDVTDAVKIEVLLT